MCSGGYFYLGDFLLVLAVCIKIGVAPLSSPSWSCSVCPLVFISYLSSCSIAIASVAGQLAERKHSFNLASKSALAVFKNRPAVDLVSFSPFPFFAYMIMCRFTLFWYIKVELCSQVSRFLLTEINVVGSLFDPAVYFFEVWRYLLVFP